MHMQSTSHCNTAGLSSRMGASVSPLKLIINPKVYGNSSVTSGGAEGAHNGDLVACRKALLVITPFGVRGDTVADGLCNAQLLSMFSCCGGDPGPGFTPWPAKAGSSTCWEEPWPSFGTTWWSAGSSLSWAPRTARYCSWNKAGASGTSSSLNA